MGEQIRLQLEADEANREVMEALRRLVPGAFTEGALDGQRLLEHLGLSAADAQGTGTPFDGLVGQRLWRPRGLDRPALSCRLARRASDLRTPTTS